MSMLLNSQCLLCQLNRHITTAQALGDEETATAFTRELMQQYLAAPDYASSPTLGADTALLFQKYYGLSPDRFRREKEASNRFALERIDSIRARIEKAQDKLYAALQFAVLGNYIDFAALQGKVSFQELEGMLDKAEELELDQAVYQRLRKDLQAGTRLLYLTDNAGEIIFDRVCGEYIRDTFPHLEITYCVRGGPAHNDATREDALLAGIPFPVIDNGTCIGGTELHEINKESMDAIRNADVILAKGQGNTETLFGCGYNIYYAFLVKCQRFVDLFGKPMFTPMLLPERQ